MSGFSGSAVLDHWRASSNESTLCFRSSSVRRSSRRRRSPVVNPFANVIAKEILRNHDGSVMNPTALETFMKRGWCPPCFSSLQGFGIKRLASSAALDIWNP
jgi:hypothetical protein